MLAMEADDKAHEICEAVFNQLGNNGLISQAFQRELARERFTDDFSNIWLEYKTARTTKPIRNIPTKADIESAVQTFQSASKTLQDVPRMFPRIGIINRNAIDRLKIDLEDMISAFNSAETHQPPAGRPTNDPTIARAVAKIIKAFRDRTKKKFPLSGDYAPGKNDENAFTSPYAEFVFQLMSQVDEDITRSMISTALRQQKPKSTAKKPPEKVD